MASVTLAIPNSGWLTVQNWSFWAGSMSLGTELSADGSEVFLRTFAMPIISSNAFVLETASDASELSQVAGPDLSTEFETNGSITIVFGSTTVVVSGGTGDTTEPYNIPSSVYPGTLNLLASAHSTASDKAVTVTFDDGGCFPGGASPGGRHVGRPHAHGGCPDVVGARWRSRHPGCVRPDPA